jgi:hypothetical protein
VTYILYHLIPSIIPGGKNPNEITFFNSERGLANNRIEKTQAKYPRILFSSVTD